MPFFKYQDNSIFLEGNSVEGTGYSLHESTKNTYNFPVDGWYWFADTATARAFFNVPEPPPQEDLPPHLQPTPLPQ